MTALRRHFFLCLIAVPLALEAQGAPSRARLQAVLDSIAAAGSFPGMSVGVAFRNGSSLGLATGLADTALGERLETDDLMLAGSVGKTYVAAVALQLVQEGRLRLDEPIATYLGREPWFARLPNGDQITVRMLMNHTSGLVRYEFKDAFTRDLTAQPDRVWQPAELVAYILGEPAPFAAGEGWDYSDTNYIVLGMIIERVGGRILHDQIRTRLLEPLRLARTVPSDSRIIAGLVQGYAGPGNPFGGTDAMIVGGRFAINPQFEWAGGGYATSAHDLARWAAALYGGTVVNDSLESQMLAGVPARLGGGATYGLGVIIRPTPLGISHGHSGFFPGYLTEVRYFPDHGVAIAFQVNSSVPRSLGGSPGAIIDALARAALATH
jgi:D-alanyl-D-alanine carboxypeptidase